MTAAEEGGPAARPPFDLDHPPSAADSSLLCHQLRAFYTVPMRKLLLLPVVRREEEDTRSTVVPSTSSSLRLLDWLCTNYAKTRNSTSVAQDGSLFNIHAGYRLALSVYRRCDFDPFRRAGEDVFFRCDEEDRVYRTTRGQANFFKWAHENGVLAFAREHEDKIVRDMARASRTKRTESKAAKEAGTRKRRKALSPPSQYECHVYSVHTTWSPSSLLEATPVASCGAVS